MNTLLPSARADRRAVVIGASLAGLLAARVLSESFDEVVLVERGDLPGDDALRRETPHTRHAHGLLARGRDVLETLFPGIGAEWVRCGALVGDLQSDAVFLAGTQRFAASPCGLQAVAVGRGVLEGTVRRRVLGLRGVRVLTHTPVASLAQEGSRVTGIVDGDGRRLDAALVVDASGRTSRLPQWLPALGWPAPREDRVEVGIRYASAYLDRDPRQAGGRVVVVCAATPDHPYPAALLAQEGGGWVLTMGGYEGDAPPLDRAGFVERARRLAPEIAEVAATSRLRGEPFGYAYPHSQRRRYERLDRFPDGLLAIGDAICSFNPIYGQGMTVAACQALALREALAGPEAGRARRYFRAAARSVDTAWSTAVGADLAIDSVKGERPWPVRLVNRYIAAVFAAARDDARVARAFLEVAHLLAEPPSLMRPAIVARVLRARIARLAGRHGRADGGAPPVIDLYSTR